MRRPSHPSSRKRRYNPLRPPENPLVTGCIAVLKSRGALVWRQNQGGAYAHGYFIRFTRGVDGISDIIGLLPGGRFCAVECKRKPYKPTKEQLTFIADVRKKGGFAVAVYSVQELIEALDGGT